MEAAELPKKDKKDHIGKLPGDDGWFRLASTPKILPWSIGLLVLLVLAIPVALILFGSDIPTRLRLATGAMFIAGLFGTAAGCDRAVQLERIRRRK